MTSYSCIPVPYNEKDIFFSVSSRSSCRSSQNHSTSGYSAFLVGAQTWITIILNGLPWKRTEIILIPKMLMFTLAISCLTTFNLPCFADLTFQVAMQYCSLQHRYLLPAPVTSTTGCYFSFGSISSFFLQLFLHCSPEAYLAPTNLRSSSFSVPSFCLFILFMGFSRQGY